MLHKALDLAFKYVVLLWDCQHIPLMFLPE
jgi:hypothetical protein